MTIFLLLLWGAAMAWMARVICGRWFNHLAVYTFFWTGMLATYELRLIAYHPVILAAWLFVFIAWVSLYLGTELARLLFPRILDRKFPPLNLPRLRNSILLLTAAGLISTGVLAERLVAALRTGGILGLAQYSGQIYEMRFESEVSGVMYLNFLPYAGCVLAGIYTARLRRITLTAALPLVAMVLDGVVSMQRAGMVIGAFLFAFSYAFTPKLGRLRFSRWHKILAASLVLGSFVVVTVQRSTGEYFEGETEVLSKVGNLVPIVPVLYMYASAPLPCFSEYLKNPSADGKALWGRYMFASIYRFLAKLGYNTYVPYYQNFYDTPVPTNVGTYLRELHRDFGASAIFLFPFGLGFLITYLEARSPTPSSVIMLVFLYVLVAFSINFDFIGGGGWYFPLPIALVVAHLIKAKAERRTLMVHAATAAP